MTHSPVLRSIYRELLRLGRAFDRAPGSKAVFPCRRNSNQTGLKLPELIYRKAQKVLYKNQLYITPSNMPIFSDQIKHIFREMGLQQQYDQIQLINAGFFGIKRLSFYWDLVREHEILDQKISEEVQIKANNALKEYLSAERLNINQETLLPNNNNIIKLTKDIRKGIFLISHPLRDSSIVFLVSHDDSNGSIGLEINQPDEQLSQSIQNRKLKNEVGKSFKGGPYQTDKNPHLLHLSPEIGGIEISEGTDTIYYSDNVANLDFQTITEKYYPFWGSCRWKPGKLESEIARGYWIPIEAPLRLAVTALEKPSSEIWNLLLEALGGDFAEFAVVTENFMNYE